MFVFAAGVVALSGSRAGAITYLGLCCLVPRPVQLPLALWLLWKRPDVRLPFAALATVTVVFAIASGYLVDWLGVLVAIGRTNDIHFANLSPTKWIGPAWLVVGVPLGAWLTLKGNVGLAGLAISPYILPAYPVLCLALGEDPLEEHRQPLRIDPGALRDDHPDRIGFRFVHLAVLRRLRLCPHLNGNRTADCSAEACQGTL